MQVEGAVDTSGDLIGVSAIQATGDILFQGNPAREDGQAPLSLWSNGDIRVNSGQFLTLKARGNITMGSGSDVETAAANGAVSSSGERVGRLAAIGDVTLAANVAISAQLLSQGDVRTSSSNRLNALRARASSTAAATPISTTVSSAAPSATTARRFSTPPANRANRRRARCGCVTRPG